jgi:hypothetical protein
MQIEMLGLQGQAWQHTQGIESCRQGNAQKQLRWLVLHIHACRISSPSTTAMHAAGTRAMFGAQAQGHRVLSRARRETHQPNDEQKKPGLRIVIVQGLEDTTVAPEGADAMNWKLSV